MGLRNLFVKCIAVILLFIPAVTSQDYIAYWDWSGSPGEDAFGTPVVLTGVEYAAVLRGVDPNVLPANGVVGTTLMELSTDWVQILRDAGVDDAIVTQLQDHYRADILDSWVLSLPAGEYNFWARTVNSFGLTSVWVVSVDMLYVNQPPVAPSPPTNLRCAPCGG